MNNSSDANKGFKTDLYNEADVDDLVEYYLNQDVSDVGGEWMEREITKGSKVVNPVLIKENRTFYKIDNKLNTEDDNLKAVTIRIAEEDLAMLKRLGKRIGLGYTQVARMIIHDSLSKRGK